MKLFVIALLFTTTSSLCFAQKNLISYEDIKYILHNNLNEADTFLVAKGYLIAKKDNKNKNRKYTMTLPGGTYNNINVRSDGRKLFIEIETNELNQYNLIRESVSQYINKNGAIGDVQTYTVKDLGDIYITVNDSVPYNPVRKEYNIQIVADKSITAYN